MAGFQDLPDEVTLQIFQHVPFSARRSILPLVCKDWQQMVLSCPTLLGSITLSGSEERRTWQLLEKAAGRVFDASRRDDKSIHLLTVARWLQRRMFVTNVSVPEDFTWAFNREQLASSLAPLLASKCSSLRHLDLASIGLVGFEHCFTNLALLENLESLRLAFLGSDFGERDKMLIETRDLEGLSALTNLKSLTIRAVMDWGLAVLGPFPESFFTLTQLKRLELSTTGEGLSEDCLLVEWDPDSRALPKRLGLLSGLEELVLDGLPHNKSFVDAVFPASLTLMSLQYNGLSSFFSAQQLHSYSLLTVLYLEYNELADLPDMSGLVSLQTLNCTHNCLAVLPVQQLLGLAAIVELNFSCQKLRGASGRYGSVEMEVLGEVVELARLGRLRSLNVTPFRRVALPAKSVRCLQGLIEAVRVARPHSGLSVMWQRVKDDFVF